MNESRANWIGVLTAGVLAASFAMPQPSYADDAKGKTVFREHKCNECHTVSAEKVERTKDKKEGVDPPDLSDVGNRHERDWIAKYIKKEETKDGKKHKKKFRGDEVEEKALLDWLTSLKSAPKKKK